MTIAFEAKYVDCGDAIDGEILQVTFDSVAESEDWKNRRDPYVLIGQNFEFPGTPTIEPKQLSKGDQKHKRGRKRPKYQAPLPGHPDTN